MEAIGTVVKIEESKRESFWKGRKRDAPILHSKSLKGAIPATKSTTRKVGQENLRAGKAVICPGKNKERKKKKILKGGGLQEVTSSSEF